MQKRERMISILAWFRLSRFYHESIRRSNQHLKKWDLTISQFDVLAQVGASEPISQQELAEKLLVTKGNVTHMLAKMEQLGWVKREREWKTKYITLTPKGKRMLEDVLPAQEQFQADQFKNLSFDEKKQLHELLKKLES
ncbi:MarR family winged helix-turn-helix transcriptional regulator [Domibacillus enclensis]|uniref:Transcriptional regulator n=1 Tax=Domibacillus enclensis TaxID=1017273 RepID=A0A1N6SHK7_9BACI|nr:MarR family transcriptional regulator [Domibacillus enclensis]OXS79331.1 transcriptional regulator [Domibacillus enclensis]SIQ40625.1 transcriptional regulator, MarR family [Domibacillus enclensis]